MRRYLLPCSRLRIKECTSTVLHAGEMTRFKMEPCPKLGDMCDVVVGVVRLPENGWIRDAVKPRFVRPCVYPARGKTCLKLVQEYVNKHRRNACRYDCSVTIPQSGPHSVLLPAH